jgi:hypothetical protein
LALRAEKEADADAEHGNEIEDQNKKFPVQNKALTSKNTDYKHYSMLRNFFQYL